MKKLRASLNCCLLCGGEGTCDGEDNDKCKISTVGIVGVVNCVSLERQLEKMFILLNVLEVPKDWCEATLLNSDGEGEGDNNPDKWFKLCDKCVEGNVKKAWTAYQNILKWQTNMLSVKLKIREGMRRSILKDNRGKRKLANRRAGGNGGRSQVDFEIKRYLFPDLFSKEVKQEVPAPPKQEVDEPPKRQRRGPPKFEDDIDLQDNYDEIIVKPEPEDPDYEPDNTPEHFDKMDTDFKMEDEDKPIKKTRPRRRRPGEPPRRRGRPPKPRPLNPPPKPLRKGRVPLPPHLHKPSFRHPIHYINQYGILQEKKFHFKTCNLCRARYAYQEDYDAHLECHEKRKNGQRPSTELDCTKCPFLARDPQELDLHLRRKHKEGPGAKAPNKYYHCPKCPYKTLGWKVIKWHALKAHPEVPLEDYGDLFNLKCKICGQSFETLQQFTRHKNTMHLGEGEGPVQCAECGVRFLTRAFLELHERKEHRGAKGKGVTLRYQCDECGMGFEFPGKLRTHKKNKHGGGKGGALREWICEVCGMDFGEKKSLERHGERFHKSARGGGGGSGGGGVEGGKGPVAWKEGGNNEVYRCQYCEVTSGVKMFIKRHVMTEHKGEMRWACDLCERRYTKKQGLDLHKKLKHGGSRSFCEWCGKGFDNEAYMRNHQKKYCRLIGVGDKMGAGGEGEKGEDAGRDLKNLIGGGGGEKGGKI